MISLIRNLDGSMETFDAALTEAECFANLCVLTRKQCLHMRLLAEELLGMAYGLLELNDGVFWIEVEGGHFELHLTAKGIVGLKTRDKLLYVSSSGKNEMHRGVTGKIRQALECNQVWSLQHYRESVSQEEKVNAWDELEKSVLGRLADDICVGVKSNRTEIMIKKTF